MEFRISDWFTKMMVHFDIIFSICLLEQSGSDNGFLFETSTAAETVYTVPEITITKFSASGSEDSQVFEFSICIFLDFKVGCVKGGSYRSRKAKMSIFSIFKK